MRGNNVELSFIHTPYHLDHLVYGSVTFQTSKGHSVLCEMDFKWGEYKINEYVMFCLKPFQFIVVTFGKKERKVVLPLRISSIAAKSEVS